MIKKYNTIHHWMVYNFGNANKCENPEHTYENPKRYEWSLKKGFEYSENRDCFWMLCSSCHKKYDATAESYRKMSLAKMGHKVGKQTREKISKANSGKIRTLEMRRYLSLKKSRIPLEDRIVVLKLCDEGILKKVEIAKRFNMTAQQVNSTFTRRYLYE